MTYTHEVRAVTHAALPMYLFIYFNFIEDLKQKQCLLFVVSQPLPLQQIYHSFYLCLMLQPDRPYQLTDPLTRPLHTGHRWLRACFFHHIDSNSLDRSGGKMSDTHNYVPLHKAFMTACVQITEVPIAFGMGDATRAPPIPPRAA